MMQVFRGKAVCDGIGMGRIHVVKERETKLEKEAAKNVNEEIARLNYALDVAEEELKQLAFRYREKVEDEAVTVFEAQAMLLRDATFLERVSAMIQEQKLNAAYCVKCIGEALACELEAIPDEYISERGADMRDVTKRLAGILMGQSEKAVGESIFPKEPFLVLGRELLPSQLLFFMKSGAQGIVLRAGSARSHVAILAKSMGIPMVVGVNLPEEEGVNMWEGGFGIVDGKMGEFILEPDEITKSQMGEVAKKEQEEQESLQELKGLENITGDGRRIALYANVGSLEEVGLAIENDAGGIGLLRSEFIYMNRESAPDEEEQFDFYRRVLEAFGQKEVIIRTFDIGADKQVPYLEMEKEENPALGLRGIRLGLAYPELLKVQLCALYRAAVYGNLKIMYPMITTLEEVQRLKGLECQVRCELKQRGVAFVEKVPVGIMVETPAAALLSHELAREVDFFSVGTNDLTQYTLACDRENPSLKLCEEKAHPAVLRLLRMTVENGHDAGISVGICGEMAAEEEMMELFLELGVDKLSVAPAKILRLRRQIRKL